MEKIVHYGCHFVCEKIHEQILNNPSILFFFYYVTIFVKSSYKLEMYSNQPLHCLNECLGCYPPLIA
jgi:hypothetical protein